MRSTDIQYIHTYIRDDKHMNTSHPNANTRQPDSSPRWKKIEVVVRSYMNSLMHFMGQMTDPKMVAFVLRSTQPLVPYIIVLPRYHNKFLKVHIIDRICTHVYKWI